MATVLIYSEAAKVDLANLRKWLTQPGSGIPAKRKLRRITRSLRQLTTTAGTHPQDRFNKNNRQLVVEGYVVSYNMMRSSAGTIYVTFDRIFGPGQDRPLVEDQQPRYRFVTTCVDCALNGPNGEAIHDMKHARHGIIDFDDILRLIGPDELRNAGLDPETLADDWAVSWEQSTWRGIPCIYIVQSGIEHIFTPNGERPGPWVDEDE